MKPKPCPFCGGKALQLADDDERLVQHCKKCGASGPPKYWAREAEAVWNERKTPCQVCKECEARK